MSVVIDPDWDPANNVEHRVGGLIHEAGAQVILHKYNRALSSLVRCKIAEGGRGYNDPIPGSTTVDYDGQVHRVGTGGKFRLWAYGADFQANILFSGATNGNFYIDARTLTEGWHSTAAQIVTNMNALGTYTTVLFGEIITEAAGFAVRWFIEEIPLSVGELNASLPNFGIAPAINQLDDDMVAEGQPWDGMAQRLLHRLSHRLKSTRPRGTAQYFGFDDVAGVPRAELGSRQPRMWGPVVFRGGPFSELVSVAFTCRVHQLDAPAPQRTARISVMSEIEDRSVLESRAVTLNADKSPHTSAPSRQYVSWNDVRVRPNDTTQIWIWIDCGVDQEAFATINLSVASDCDRTVTDNNNLLVTLTTRPEIQENPAGLHVEGDGEHDIAHIDTFDATPGAASNYSELLSPSPNRTGAELGLVDLALRVRVLPLNVSVMEVPSGAAEVGDDFAEGVGRPPSWFTIGRSLERIQTAMLGQTPLLGVMLRGDEWVEPDTNETHPTAGPTVIPQAYLGWWRFVEHDVTALTWVAVADWAMPTDGHVAGGGVHEVRYIEASVQIMLVAPNVVSDDERVELSFRTAVLTAAARIAATGPAGAGGDREHSAAVRPFCQTDLEVTEYDAGLALSAVTLRDTGTPANDTLFARAYAQQTTTVANVRPNVWETVNIIAPLITHSEPQFVAVEVDANTIPNRARTGLVCTGGDMAYAPRTDS